MKNSRINSSLYKIKLQESVFSFSLDTSYAPSPRNDFAEKSAKELHSHSEYELFFIVSGSLQLVAPNEESEYTSGIVCIPPSYLHYTRRTGDVFRLLLSFKPAKNKISHITRFFKKFLQKKVTSCLLNNSVSYYLNEINKISLDQFLYFREKTTNLLSLIVYEVFSVNNRNIKDFLPKNENYLLQIDDIIFNQYAANPSINTIAQEICLSPKQVSRIIKKNYNRTFTELINERKMTVATSLLLETNKSVSEIIIFLNYETENYFYSLFKKKFGCTPLQYRKQNKKN